MHIMHQLSINDITHFNLLRMAAGLTWWILYRHSATTCEHQDGWLLQVQVHDEILLRSNTTATLKFPLACCILWGGITDALRWNPINRDLKTQFTHLYNLVHHIEISFQTNVKQVYPSYQFVEPLSLILFCRGVPLSEIHLHSHWPSMNITWREGKKYIEGVLLL